MNSEFPKLLKATRHSKGLKIKEVSIISKIDQALISKYESGSRKPTEDHLQALASAYQGELGILRNPVIAEKIYNIVRYEKDLDSIWALAETRIEYLRRSDGSGSFDLPETIRLRLQKLDQLNLEYKKLHKQQNTQKEKAQKYFALNYTYESNKIEGNTMTLQETMLVINEGITISGKSIREHLEAINHSEAIELLFDFVHRHQRFDERTLLQLHGMILRGIDRQNAGSYRRNNVRILGSSHTPPEPYLVPKLMEDYFHFYETNVMRIHPVILAAEMHERLVTIHPFIDGNGRTSRLAMNLILMMNEYPVAILKGDQDSRLSYFKALELVQTDANPIPFYQLIIDRLEATLLEYIELLRTE
ncbi:MAG: Fic family protein [Saprospiraceae bacterium]